MGISGANFGVAETGTICLVTNEGNGRMVTTLPRVHVAVMGIEKVVPSMTDLDRLLKVLARSGTGQKLSVYTTLIHGPRRARDADGPAEAARDPARQRPQPNPRGRDRGNPRVHPVRRVPQRVSGVSQHRRTRLRRHVSRSRRRRPDAGTPRARPVERIAGREHAVRRLPRRVSGAARYSAHAARAAKGRGGVAVRRRASWKTAMRLFASAASRPALYRAGARVMRWTPTPPRDRRLDRTRARSREPLDPVPRSEGAGGRNVSGALAGAPIDAGSRMTNARAAILNRVRQAQRTARLPAAAHGSRARAAGAHR